jgi:FKBP-type peptidyl-prolyl cis-trans isomerase 2
LDDGTLFDSSEGRPPLEFVVASGQVISGFDDAVTGLAAGESRSVRIPPEKAYGPVREDLLFRVDRTVFSFEPEVGMQVRMGLPSGEALVASIATLEEEQVLLDGNHELAGKALNFDVTLAEILEA